MSRLKPKAQRLHKHDPGAYRVEVFCRLHRKRGQSTRPNLMSAIALSDRWARMTGGSAVIVLVVRNTALGRPSYPEAWQ
jgi:hypothetical protein